MRPRINQSTQPTYGSEIYTIQHHADIFFYRRVEAIKKTIEVAKQKRTEIIMLLNDVPFCRFEKNGSYKYIYDASKDKKSSPELKQLFRMKGIAIN